MPISHQKMRTCQPEKGLVKTISLILPLLNKRSSIKIWWDCNGVRIFNGEEEREGDEGLYNSMRLRRVIPV